MLSDERLAQIIAGVKGNEGCRVCLTFDAPPEEQPGCDECIFESREGAAILAELQEARQIMAAIAESEPYCETGMGDIECALCNGHETYQGDYRDTFRHEPDCPLAMARALMGRMGKAND